MQQHPSRTRRRPLRPGSGCSHRCCWHQVRSGWLPAHCGPVGLSQIGPTDPPRSRCAGAAVARAQLKLWDQCGGQGGNCKEAGECVDGPFAGKACPSASSCLKQSNWYYQCLPTEGYTCIPTNGNSPGAPSGSTGGAQYTLGWWDQCGGMGGNCAGYQCLDGWYPNYACPSGTSCQRQNQWYYQCLPGGSGGATLNVWDQCGGKGGNCAGFACVDGPYPGQSCPSGTSCQRKREARRRLHFLARPMAACPPCLPASTHADASSRRGQPAPCCC
jgi:hypothetical protein